MTTVADHLDRRGLPDGQLPHRDNELVSVSHAVPGTEGVNAMVELYSSAGTDPGTAPIYTLDFGMNFRMSQHVILDIGLNLGLNSAAPKAQVYTGISVRF